MKGKPKLNKDWHEAHPMPDRPSAEQRIAWHLDHFRHCGCRPIPEKLKRQMVEKGIKFND